MKQAFSAAAVVSLTACAPSPPIPNPYLPPPGANVCTQGVYILNNPRIDQIAKLAVLEKMRNSGCMKA